MGIIFPKIFENFLDLDIFSKTANIPQNQKLYLRQIHYGIIQKFLIT